MADLDAFTDSSTGVPLLGGDMADWRDGVACCPLVAQFVTTALSAVEGRVLLIGPRAAALAGAFDSAVIAVRGLLDAAELSGAGYDARCASLAHVPDDACAAVVCLDAPERVLSPDDEPMRHLQVLNLVRSLAPVSVVAVDNGACVDALRPAQPHSLDADTAWWLGAPGYDVRPPVARELADATAGFDCRFASVLPDPETARAIVPLDGPVVEAVWAALGDQPAWQAVLANNGAHDLAGAWLVLSGLPRQRTLTTPLASVGELTEANPDAHEDVPGDGRPLEPELRFLLASDSRSQLRRLFGRYLDWICSLDPRLRPYAVVRNTVLIDGGFAIADDSWRLRAGTVHRTDDTLAAAAVTLEFADSVAGRAGAHPFGASANPEEIAAQLLGLVGRSSADLRDARVLLTHLGLTERPAPRREPSRSDRDRELESELRSARSELAILRQDLEKSLRRNRALEHAMATEHGTRALRAFKLMTAPTSRVSEALRSRLKR